MEGLETKRYQCMFDMSSVLDMIALELASRPLEPWVSEMECAKGWLLKYLRDIHSFDIPSSLEGLIDDVPADIDSSDPKLFARIEEALADLFSYVAQLNSESGLTEIQYIGMMLLVKVHQILVCA